MMKFWEIYDKYVLPREGGAFVKAWLQMSDFEKAPASTKYHEAYEGGLMEHSVKVFYEFCRLLKAYPEVECSAETAATICLLHDVCKIDFYKVEYRNKKDADGKWIQVPYYIVDERDKYGGHGSKSVYMLMNCGMQLRYAEAVAIQNHMGDTPACFEAYRQIPLAFLLHTADMAATINFRKDEDE